MYFDPTPQNMTALLVVALALVTLVFLLRGRWDSNLPLFYYVASIFVASFTDQPSHPYLMLVGACLAMVLRFEFMSKGFTRFIGVLTSLAIGASMVALLGQVFEVRFI